MKRTFQRIGPVALAATAAALLLPPAAVSAPPVDGRAAPAAAAGPPAPPHPLPYSPAPEVAAPITEVEAGRAFWAFRSPRPVSPPVVRDTAWPSSEIDAFILARLESAGLKPGPDATPEVLVRRVYVDLTGLPPTPEQVDAYTADPSPRALAELVDHLLGSPQFGQRWGRHWLDVARYADSSGGGRAILFPDAWRYRDYVVAAFNDDVPYDRFLAEQIAGDILAAGADGAAERSRLLMATGFLALGPSNFELQDKTLLEMDVIDEQIDTLGRAVLGMTLGCARCHDHKFDPVPTEDYYALAGIFRSTQTLEHANVSKFVTAKLPPGGPEDEATRGARAAVARLEKEIRALQSALGDAAAPGASGVQVDDLPGIVVDDVAAERAGEWMASTAIPRWVGAGYVHDKGEAKGAKWIRFGADLPAAGTYEVSLAYSAASNRSPGATVTVSHRGGKDTIRVDQRIAPPRDKLFFPLGRFEFAAGRAEVTVANRDTTGVVIADAVQWLPLDGAPDTTDAVARTAGTGTGEGSKSDAAAAAQAAKKDRAHLQGRLKGLEKELAAAKKKIPPPTVAMAVREGDKPADHFICIRGDVHSPGPVVPRGFLQVASRPGAARPAIPAQQSGRLALAAWLTDPANPLTARVMANRVWHHLLGRGIVPTPDNFGTTGRPPSHPALLDHLALRFIAGGWSVKRLVRAVVLSRTYRLSSQAQPGTAWAETDPGNRLFWRAERRRLDAETLRDAILSASGRLDPSAGGPAFGPGTKSEFGYRYGSRRRSLYLPVFRNSLNDLFFVFDFADPNLVTGRRTRTTRPTQALYLMNSPFVLEQARHAASGLLARTEEEGDGRLERAYRSTLGRPPAAQERRLALAFLQKARSSAAMDGSPQPELEAWTQLLQSLFACLDFRYLD